MISILIATSSCASLKPASKTAAQPSASKKISSNNNATVNLQFINDIEVKQEKSTNSPVNKPGANIKLAATESKPSLVYSFDIENASPIQFAYASRLGTDVEAVSNVKLFETIEDWWGTPYRLGGHTKEGVDCSAFVYSLMLSVYAINLPRTSKEQYQTVAKIDDEELSEGDLVFFNTRGGISHVGIYLTNNKFVHASTSGGVMISDLNEAYWKTRYKGAGRVK